MRKILTDDNFEFIEVDEIPEIEHKIYKKRSTPTRRCIERFLKSGAKIVKIECDDENMTKTMKKRLSMYVRNNELQNEIGVSSRKTDIYLYRKEEDVSS